MEGTVKDNKNKQNLSCLDEQASKGFLRGSSTVTSAGQHENYQSINQQLSNHFSRGFCHTLSISISFHDTSRKINVQKWTQMSAFEIPM